MNAISYMEPDAALPHNKKRRHSSLTDPMLDNISDPRPHKILKSFTEREEALRAITTCKICFRPLYEPFTAQCGHTYCYSCLCQWFGNATRGQKTCPDCRTVITNPPAPAYALREITRELLQRPELYPGEDLVAHAQLQKEEASVVEKDRLNTDLHSGGLFKGYFRQVLAEPRLAPLHDLEDGVIRCPGCAWELEGDNLHCDHCGFEFDSESDTFYSSEEEEEEGDETTQRVGTDDELDGDMSVEDQEFNDSMNAEAEDDAYSSSQDSEAANAPRREHNAHFRAARDALHLDSESDDSSDHGFNEYYIRHGRYHDDEDGEEDSADEDETSSMQNFIVDDNDLDEHESETSASTTTELQPQATRRVRYTIVDSDDEDASERSSDSDTSGSESAIDPSSKQQGSHLYDKTESSLVHSYSPASTGSYSDAPSQDDYEDD